MSVLAGKSIWVSGGSGAFGQAFIKHCLLEGARRVVCFSRSESRQAAMKAAVSDPRARFMIGDVRDEQRVLQSLRDVDFAVHAAALKRVEVCESDPGEAIATNVQGTIAVARACVAAGVDRAVFTSTDKAAAPNTLYGASKLAAERLWCGWNAYSPQGTSFFATRYGNVINSTGSVVPIWREQAKSGCIFVTDPNASRFWMSMAQAVELVCSALQHARRGTVMVPKIGAAALDALAEAVAPNLRWRTTQLGASEKRHETLISEDEARRVAEAISWYSILPAEQPWTDEYPLILSERPAGWSYRSDTAKRLSVDELREMIRE